MKPGVCASMSRMLGSREGARVAYFAAVPPEYTRSALSSGMYLEAGSSSANRFSSNSVISATLAIGLVIE